MENVKYKLGPKANYFYDPTNGKKVVSGKEVEFTAKDLLSKRTRAAINSLHLVKVESSAKQAQTPVDLEEKFRTAFEKGGPEEVNKSFKKAELVELAEKLDFEVLKEDTKEVLVEAIQSEFYPDPDGAEE